VSRRNDMGRIRLYLRLLINGEFVAKTREVMMTGLTYEFHVGELFQVKLFTMPTSIQLEVVLSGLKDRVVDVIDLEVPGTHVKALTSASQLIKEYPFSNQEFNLKKLKAQGKEPPNKQPEGEEGKKEPQADIKGEVSAKAEWRGEGPEMPPVRAENLFKRQAVTKNRKEYTEEEQERMLMRELYIDVNDPRNEKIIRFLRETKNEFLKRLLEEDAKNPLHDMEPFRHKLIKARLSDPNFSE